MRAEDLDLQERGQVGDLPKATLIDTSAWILALRKGISSRAMYEVDRRIMGNRAATAGIIMLELLSGTRTEREYQELKEDLETLIQLETIEINDGNHLGYRGRLFYDLAKVSAIRLAYAMSVDLRKYNVAVIALTPGYLRSEKMLEEFGVTEENWQDVIKMDPGFKNSETPYYVGRAVVALATDPNIMQKTGRALCSGWLARGYGFTDVDGRQPVFCGREGVFSEDGFAIEKANK